MEQVFGRSRRLAVDHFVFGMVFFVHGTKFPVLCISRAAWQMIHRQLYSLIPCPPALIVKHLYLIDGLSALSVTLGLCMLWWDDCGDGTLV